MKVCKNPLISWSPTFDQKTLTWVSHPLSFLDTYSDNKSYLQAELPSEFFPLLWRVLLSPLKFMSQISCIILSHQQVPHNNTHSWEMRGGGTSWHKIFPRSGKRVTPKEKLGCSENSESHFPLTNRKIQMKNNFCWQNTRIYSIVNT